MGKHKKKRKAPELLDKPEKLTSKLLKWTRRGKHRRLDDILSQCGGGAAALTDIKDAQGRSLLHQACLAGHEAAVNVLLKYGADTEAQDTNGDTPAHLAAHHGHLVILQALLQCKRPPDIHIYNRQGISIEQLVLNALHASDTQQTRAHFTRSGSEGSKSESESEEAAWRRRLAEEASDGEGYGGGALGDDEDTARHGWGGAEVEDDDAWADRMWAEMQGRRRAAARAASRSFASSFKEARAAQEAQEEAARVASMERLRAAQEALKQEQERDARWRARAAALPVIGPQLELPPLDPAAARASYETRWAEFERVVSDMLARVSVQGGVQGAASSSNGKPAGLTFEMVAWPLPEGYAYDVDTLRDVLLSGVQGPADIKKRVRGELVRWHPDKFESRVSRVLAAADRERVMSRVKELSQALTRIMSA